MTQRERTMATVLGAIVVFGGAIFGGLWFYKAITNAVREIDDTTDLVKKNRDNIKRVHDSEPMLVRWERLSLPADHKLASREYRKELNAKFIKHEVIDLNFPDEQGVSTSTLTRQGNDPVTNKPGKVNLWTGVNFQVNFKAKLANLVALIKDLQTMPRMHRIKSLSIQRSDEKKEGEMLTVSMSFEALSILDAQKVQNKAGVPDIYGGITGDERGFKAAGETDVALALTRGPMGLGALAWSASPWGPYKPPLNPPQTWLRNYADIARTNIFMGFSEVGGEKADAFGPVPPDDVINMMRFSRFISFTDDDGKVEARLWGQSTNKKERLKTAGGFNRFPMLQSGNLTPVIQGTVLKIEENNVIFRVGVKSSSPSSSRWWRYPTEDTFFSLHPDDLAKLVKEGKVSSEIDKSSLFLVNETYWKKLISKNKITMYDDDKSFRVPSDNSRGDVVFSDPQVSIVRLSSWPLKGPQHPSVSAGRLYPDENLIYSIQKNHMADLVTDKSLIGTKKEVKAGDVDRMFAMQTKFWDLLTHQRVIKTNSGQGTFTFGAQGAELVKGDVISRTEDLVVIRVAEKYCHSAGEDGRWHEGFCILRIGGFLQDALASPLPNSRLSEFITPVAAARADD